MLTADRSIEAELTSSTRSVPDCFDYGLELAREEPCLDANADVFFCFLPFFEVFAFVAWKAKLPPNATGDCWRDN